MNHQSRLYFGRVLFFAVAVSLWGLVALQTHAAPVGTEIKLDNFGSVLSGESRAIGR